MDATVLAAKKKHALPLSCEVLERLHKLAALPVPDAAALEQTRAELEPLVALINSIRSTASRVPHIEEVALLPRRPAAEALEAPPGTEPLDRAELARYAPQRSRSGYYVAP